MQKLKNSRINWRFYWKLLAIVTTLLLIPFRIEGIMMQYVYMTLAIFFSFALFYLLYRFGKRSIAIMLLLCALLSLGQTYLIENYEFYPVVAWSCPVKSYGLLEIINCDTNPCGDGEMIQYASLQGVPINILIQPRQWNGRTIYGLC